MVWCQQRLKLWFHCFVLHSKCAAFSAICKDDAATNVACSQWAINGAIILLCT